jgi:amino acid transporter
VASTLAVVVIYLILIVLAAGALPQSQLVDSASPFADVIYAATGGYWAGGFIALGGAVSAIGCAGPWILSGGVVAHSMSTMDLLPKSLSKVSRRGTPVNALLVNGVLMTAIMLLAWATQEGSLYNFFVMLATMAYLVFYAFGAASEIVLSGKKIKPFSLGTFIKCSLVSLVGLLYAIYTIYGSGAEYVFYGFLLMMAGLPVFIYVKLKAEAEREADGDVSRG